MADLKISQLTGATTPLAGTEVLPIVQSNATKKIASDDLTVKNVRSNATTGILQIAGPGAGATRVMTTPDANFSVARTDAAQSFTGAQTLASAKVTGDTNFGANYYGGMKQQTFGTTNNGAYQDFTLPDPRSVIGGGAFGILMVGQNYGGSTYTDRVYALMLRGTDATFTQLAEKLGNGGYSFSVSCPSNGVIRITNTSGGFSDEIDVCFIGTGAL